MVCICQYQSPNSSHHPLRKGYFCACNHLGFPKCSPNCPEMGLLIKLSFWQCSRLQTLALFSASFFFFFFCNQCLLNTYNMRGSVLGTVDRNKNKSRRSCLKSSRWWERQTNKSNLCSVLWISPGLGPENHGSPEKVDGCMGTRGGGGWQG